MAEKIAVLAAGGGSRGIYQAGMMLALKDMGVKYDAIFTSSVGCLNSLIFQAGDYEKLTDLWLNIKPGDVYEDLGAVDYVASFKRKYLHNSQPLRDLIAKHINYDVLMKNPVEFWINTTCLTDNSPYSREAKSFINEDQLIDFAFASASPPIYFPTVHFEGKELCDAGVINNYSITESLNDGYTTLILLLPNKPPPTSSANNILDMISNIFSVSMQSYMDRESKSIIKINNVIDTISGLLDEDKCSALLSDKDFPNKIKLILIAPEQQSSFTFLDFNYEGLNRQALMDYGYERCKSIVESELNGS